MSNLSKAVGEFLAERGNFITAINNCPASNQEDYWRWQGHAEARRVLRETLEHRGINLQAELDLESPELQDRLATACGDPGSIVGRQHHINESISRWSMRAVLHVLAEAQAKSTPVQVTEHRDLPIDFATIKAEALREAATAARADAANARTPQGHAEATTYADWLDDRATEIDPARLEGAHP
jgi:hypothetical protein